MIPNYYSFGKVGKLTKERNERLSWYVLCCYFKQKRKTDYGACSDKCFCPMSKLKARDMKHRTILTNCLFLPGNTLQLNKNTSFERKLNLSLS